MLVEWRPGGLSTGSGRMVLVPTGVTFAIDKDGSSRLELDGEDECK